MKNKTKIYLPFFILIVTIYIAFLSLQGMQHKNFSLRFHEYSAIVLQVSIILIFIEFLVSIIYTLINIKRFKLVKLCKTEKIIAFIIIISVIYIIAITYIQLNYKESGGIFTNIEKVKINDMYYVVLDGKEIHCTENEYNLIENDEKYMIKYKWNLINHRYTKLLTIKHTK